MKLLLLLVIRIFLLSMNFALFTRLNDPFDNKFLKYHQGVANEAQLKDCWLCTHSPVVAKTMPYLAAPLSEEMMNPECLQPQPWTDAVLN